MSQTSGIPAFKAALQAALQARAGLAGVQVVRRFPIMPETEYIWIATARGRQKVAAMRAGGNPREEASIQDVIIRVDRSNLDDESEASNRAFVLMGELEQELRANAQVNNSVRFAEMGSYELDEWIDAEQSHASLLVEVLWGKRLDP